MYSRKLLRTVCAASIFVGALMHAAGLHQAVRTDFAGPWWMYAVFWTAIIGYSASAVGILFEKRIALLFAVLGPVTGGALIFLGLVSERLDFQILIPGTFSNEINPLGFVTLVVEPMAVLSAFLLLFDRPPHRR